MNLLKACIFFTDKLVNVVIILIMILFFIFGVYSLWDSHHIYDQSKTSQYETYKPSSADNLSLDELKQINPEVFGWLTIEGTNVDYPLVQAADNSKYVNTDAKGEFALGGSIFLDSRNKNDFSDVNNIVYGHNMEQHAMFGELKDFGNAGFFETHKYGKLYYDERWHQTEFFAFATVDAYDTSIYNPYLKDMKDIAKYVSYIKHQATQYRELSQYENNRFIVLSTCTSTDTNGRHILVGRIKD